MAELLSNVVWEGLSSEMTDDLSELRDGQFFKQNDTGESYFRRNGSWEFINLGLSFIKATKSGRITTDGNGYFHVAFNTPFADTDYTVALTTEKDGVNLCTFKNLTANGFDIYTLDARSALPNPNIVVSWLATRDYNP